ncbi:Glycosyl transferase family 8 [Dendrosporobacter quercicolus]|uniref:Glycosyl transferase family 8 n=1 Tax=Dendrosporobacter quercicolus TaxID=146817 RepID=A0A1G9YTK7_9FIRM|nr:Glycosyl transferase family 8 [Dendrosporobacter quercicolus]
MYLDADILCLQKISELVHLDMGKHLTAVVSDVLSVARRQSEALNLQSECYFNAGVLLINVHQWLKQNISEKALSLLSDRSKNYVFLDQDALNLILDNAKKFYLKSGILFLKNMRILAFLKTLYYCTAPQIQNHGASFVTKNIKPSTLFSL